MCRASLKPSCSSHREGLQARVDHDALFRALISGLRTLTAFTRLRDRLRRVFDRNDRAEAAWGAVARGLERLVDHSRAIIMALAGASSQQGLCRIAALKARPRVAAGMRTNDRIGAGPKLDRRFRALLDPGAPAESPITHEGSCSAVRCPNPAECVETCWKAGVAFWGATKIKLSDGQFRRSHPTTSC